MFIFITTQKLEELTFIYLELSNWIRDMRN